MTIIPIASGKCSYFGGPLDGSVGTQEGLSCISDSDLNNWWFRRLFLTLTWDSSKGLARNLNPRALYCAMRWNYGTFDGIAGEILVGYSRQQIRDALFIVSANGNETVVQASDWGPNKDTERLIDLSPGACTALGVSTDDVVSVSAIL